MGSQQKYLKVKQQNTATSKNNYELWQMLEEK
jgi:hypothetical protein